jgi:hypothetical protein
VVSLDCPAGFEIICIDEGIFEDIAACALLLLKAARS